MQGDFCYHEDMILGIDEVGRGPWAGPLVVGAVILGCEIDGITDSKKLSLKRRLELDNEIRAKAKAVALGWVEPNEIDTLGIASALELACKRACTEIDTLGVAYTEIIIDGTVNFLKNTSKGAFVTTMKKADLLVPSVSAASIVAKVARDNYMKQQAGLYPEYGLASHVGYGTAAHQAAIKKHGVTPLHRLSFAPLSEYRTAFSPSSSSGTASLRVTARTHVPRETRAAGVSGKETASGIFTAKFIGDNAESVAVHCLENLGHSILERNWRTKFCEIDIISMKDGTVYFVEVKYRKDDKAGDGLLAITPKKLRQMQFAAALYINSHQSAADFQLAAIAASGDPPEVTDYITII